LRLTVKVTNLFLDYPKGLRTVSNLDLEARSEGTSFLVGGTAQILEGEHREAINLQTLKASSISPPGSGPVLERIRLDIRIQTTSPLRVDNNLARVDAYADLHLAGTLGRPTLLGRLEMDEGGRVYISERVFTLTRAAVTFTNENTIEPTLDLKADTRISDYIVTINATGGLKDLAASFTSDPAATEEQIYSLLLTGSVNNTDKISSGSLSSRQALSLFGSTMMGSFNMRMRRMLRVSDFRIEPSLISPDSDPTARLTIGQSFTPELRLTYSTNLQNSNDQIWIGEYDWRRTILGRYVSQTEDSDRGELRHKLRFGGGDATGDIRSTRRTESVRLDSFDVEGELALPKEEVVKQLKLKAGQKYDSFQVQKRIEELTRLYAQQGYLEMTVRQERDRDELSVRLRLVIHAGRSITFAFHGIDIPKGVREQVAEAWQKNVVDAQRLLETSAVVRRHLVRKQFCDATVAPRIETEDAVSKKIVFDIVPGPRFERVAVTFDGPRAGLAKDLRAALRKAGLDTESAANPEAVQREVARYLEAQGYLSADVAGPRVDRKPEAGSYESIIQVRTGPRYRLGSLQFEGNTHVADGQLLKALGAKSGDHYVSTQRGEFTSTLQDLYWRKGYREVTIETVEQRRAEGVVDLRFRLTEGRLSVIAGILVEGNVKTSEAFLRRRIPLNEGQPVDGDKLDRIRRRLFDSGTYSMVDLTLQPSATGSAEPSGVVPTSSAPTQPLDLKLRVREPKPFSLDYGFTYDSSRGAGVIVDFSNRNMLGEGRYLGYRILVDKEERNQRVYFVQPFLGRSDINTTLDVTREEGQIDELKILKESITLQQQIEFRRRFTFSYGYRFQSARSMVEAGSDPFPVKATTSPVISALSRDTRDDVFDATRGSYTSHGFEIAPRALGGDLGYYRYFGQYFKYFGITRPGRVPFHEVSRPRFVFATGIRVGFLSPIEGGIITPAERFFGGGSSTIRGFKQNDLGPKLPDGQPIGGQSLLFLNFELRTPLYKLLDTAAFADIGNVWEKVSDFSLTDLRKTAGFGIRIRNPFIMIRFDYGWKLDWRPGESKGAFHFSIGQAF
jgi:outer membrane protein assembly complex protein YaeT